MSPSNLRLSSLYQSNVPNAQFGSCNPLLRTILFPAVFGTEVQSDWNPDSFTLSLLWPHYPLHTPASSSQIHNFLRRTSTPAISHNTACTSFPQLLLPEHPLPHFFYLLRPFLTFKSESSILRYSPQLLSKHSALSNTLYSVLHIVVMNFPFALRSFPCITESLAPVGCAGLVPESSWPPFGFKPWEARREMED